jgi:pimeloyl-ACP methyl ester carboxylesterase
MTPEIRFEDAGFEERFLTSQDGLRLYYRDYGGREPRSAAAAKTPLLCLPGLTRNSKDFHGFAARLAAERRVICPDYRGRGRSAYDPNWRHYEARVYIDDIRHLLAATNLHHVVVVGTSLGGLLAMAMAVAVATALAGVVLNDVGPAVNADALTRILAHAGDGRTQPDWESAARHLRRSLPHLSIDTEEGWLRMAHSTYREGADGLLHVDWDVTLVKPLLRRRRAPDLWPLFRALRRVPVVAVRGGVSDVLTEATFARMKAEKPDLVQVTVPGVGHAPSLGEPDAARAIGDFLAARR